MIKSIRALVVLLAVLAFGGYVYLQTQNFIEGAVITVFDPANGASVEEEVVKIKGRAENISWITLNGRKIFVDEEGFFSEKEVLSPGHNTVVIEAGDKYGKTDRETVSIYNNSPKTLSHRRVSEEPLQADAGK